MITKAWKVYGKSGHRQRESFYPSAVYDFSDRNGIRIIAVQNADKTGTNDCSVLIITMDTLDQVMNEFEGQLYDGVFENSNFGKVVEI